MEEESNFILEKIGNNIKTARNARVMTQDYLAEQLNVSDKFISMAERGVSGLSITSIVNICKILHIEPNALFSGIIDYNDDLDEFIKEKVSLLSNNDKYFVKDVIKYIFEKGNR